MKKILPWKWHTHQNEGVQRERGRVWRSLSSERSERERDRDNLSLSLPSTPKWRVVWHLKGNTFFYEGFYSKWVCMPFSIILWCFKQVFKRKKWKKLRNLSYFYFWRWRVMVLIQLWLDVYENKKQKYQLDFGQWEVEREGESEMVSTWLKAGQ